MSSADRARMPLTADDVRAAAARVEGVIRPLAIAPYGPIPGATGGDGRLWLALEHLQHSGSFKARGAVNFLRAHRDADTLPRAGVTIASGGNAGLALAWAAATHGVAATVFVPTTAPSVKVALLHSLGAQVRPVGTEFAHAAQACEEFAAGTGALRSHAYDERLVAAGAGTLVEELRRAAPHIDTIVLAVGGGGLLAGVATAAEEHGVRVVGVEPERCCALWSAVQAGEVVDVTVDSVAADALGARRVTDMALSAVLEGRAEVVRVPDAAIIAARRSLWQTHRLVVEHAAGAALAAVGVPDGHAGYDAAYGATDDARYGAAYDIDSGAQIAVLLCGANTDPGDLVPAREDAAGTTAG